MTDRVKKLREESLSATPRLSMERARIETETYKKYEGTLSVPELRARCLYEYNARRTLWLGDGELIVGEKTEAPAAAPTFPELCCHTVEDILTMGRREQISFASTEDDIAFQRDVVIPFWESRQMRSRILGAMTDEWRDAYAAGIFTEFMEQRGPGHTVGSDKIFAKGFADYKADIAAALAALDRSADDYEARSAELRAMDIACDAVIVLGRRYAALARETAKRCADPVRKAELYDIAAVCDVVPEHAPRTFRQALQHYWFVHLCVTTELNPWDAYSPGRLDQHLRSFYESGIASGEITRDSALELLECLWVKFNNQPAPPKVGVTLKESGTYTDFANINTGGVAPDGSDGVSEVSYLILDCMDEMKLLQPSSNVQISEKTPREFILRAAEISRKGWGQPAFYSTEAIIAELLNAGKSLEDALRGGTSGCVETGAFGREAYILTGYFNIPKILELTLHDGFDPRTGRQLGPHTGKDFADYDELFDAFAAQIKYFVDIKVEGSNKIERLYGEMMPVPFLSVLTDDCIARGRDYNGGGARYNTSYIQGVGIGTVTDALSVYKNRVYGGARDIDAKTLADALAANFEGCEELRSSIKRRTPFYGNDDDAADEIMQSVFRLYRDTVTHRKNWRGGEYRVNMLPTTCHVYFGSVTGATANGRLAGVPLSEGISPEHGADTHGPTAVLRSAAKMEQLTTGGTLLNQKFTPATLAGDESLGKFADLIRSYFAMGGHHIQFNVIDRQTLLDAQAHPEEYRDLIVRVAGYSDHFRNLDRALQDEIIARTEQTL